jgi:hypothetical protein
MTLLKYAKSQNTYIRLSYFTVSIFIYLKTWKTHGCLKCKDKHSWIKQF